MKSYLSTAKNPTIVFLITMLIICVSCNRQKIVMNAADQAYIQKYLDLNVLAPAFGGKIYSAHKIFQANNHELFVWAYIQEYYFTDGKLQSGTGWSVPMVLMTERNSGQITIKSHNVPRDGAFYSEDIGKLFPKEIQQAILHFPGSGEMKELETYSRKRAEKQ